MTLRLVTAPAKEPVTTQEALDWAHLDAGNVVTTVIEQLITAARTIAEQRTGPLITQTWELVLDRFPTAEIELGLMPVQAITSVKYFDADGVEQTLAGTAYTLDKDTPPSWLLPAYGTSWPDTSPAAQAVTIRFDAGWGDNGSDVPAPIRSWIGAQIAAAWQNPAALIDGQAKALPFLDGLLDAYVVPKIG